MATLKDLFVLGVTNFVGNVIATGTIKSEGGFIGNLTGNVTGNSTTATTATKVANNSVIKFDAGATEGTDLYTFNGSAAKTIDIKAGTNISLTKTAGTITIANTYTHPTTAGNKHVPSGGSSGQFLGWDSAGTAKWVNNPNTDTKVTEAANHYSPQTDSGSNLTANASGATAAWSIDVVKGVTLNRDTKGHVTGLSVTSGKIPANPNTTYTLSSPANANTIVLTPSSGTANTVTLKAGSNITLTGTTANEISIAGTANNYNTNLTAADSTNANVYNLLLSNSTATTAENNVSPRKANNLTYKQSTGELKTTQLSINDNLWQYIISEGFLYTNHKKSEITNCFVIDNGGNTFEIGVKQQVGYSDNAWNYGYITFDDDRLSIRHNSGDINLTAEECMTIVTNNDHLSLIAHESYVQLISHGGNAKSYVKIDASHLWLHGDSVIHFDSPEFHFRTDGMLRANYIKGGFLKHASYITNFDEIHGKIMDGLVFRYRNNYLTCSTAKTTAAKVITETTGTGIDTFGTSQLVAGAKIAVKFTNGSRVANATLNINSTGAKNIRYNGANITAEAEISPNRIYELIYNGTQWEIMGDLYANDMILTTYANLVSLRTNSKLIPGQKYRITDYTTTTTQTDTQSAGNVFDIIVTADDVNKLNENARAIQHSGDTYFNSQHLDAWELKYSLDNDTARFAWADSTNGKGVIYYMRDEYGNECGYDFKNIQMKFYKITAVQDISTNFVNTYTGSKQVGGSNLEPRGCTISTTDTEWRYTFDFIINNTNPHYDYSLNKWQSGSGSNNHKLCYNNKINQLYGIYGGGYTNKGKQYINFISFRNTASNSTNVSSGCYGNEFGNRNYNNSFGDNCYSNSFGDDCYSNNFTNNCYYNIFGNWCLSNSFGNSCLSNSFGNECISNKFGKFCEYNSFGNFCDYNKFGDYCQSNNFGNNCCENSFGNGCYKYININFGCRIIKLGFDGDINYGFINTGDVDEDSEEVYVEGTIHNNFNVSKTVNISIDFIIKYSNSGDDEKTVTQSVTIPANDSLDFRIATSYDVKDFDTFFASGTARFTVGSTTIISEGCYEW